MSSGIRFTNREMRSIALFESITGAGVKDCIIDEKLNRIIYVVNQGESGLAIGKGGRNIHLLEKMTGKKHEVVEYSENPITFIKNSLRPAQVKEIRITERPDGKKIAVVSVSLKNKGIAIGRNGEKAERTRLLAKRYFQIDKVSIL